MIGSSRVRARYSPEERAAWVAEFHSSGETQQGFARRHGIKWTTFRNWLSGRAKSGTRAAAIQAPVRLREIEIGPLLQPHPWAAEIALSSGVVVRLKGEADPAWVQAIVQPLLEPC